MLCQIELLTCPIYGYDWSESIPWLSMTYWKARLMNPPLQPWLPYFEEQSTRFWGLRSTNFPVFLANWPSRAPAALKAQQAPQAPWIQKKTELKRLKCRWEFKSHQTHMWWIYLLNWFWLWYSKKTDLATQNRKYSAKVNTNNDNANWNKFFNKS